MNGREASEAIGSGRLKDGKSNSIIAMTADTFGADVQKCPAKATGLEPESNPLEKYLTPNKLN